MACSSSQSLSSATEPDSESADSVTTNTSSPQSAALSLLDKLRPPKTSELSRKRNIQENPSKGKRCRLPRGSQSDPKSVTLSERVMLLHVLDIISCGCEHNGFCFEHNDFVIM